MLELVHDFLDFVLSVHFNFKIVSCISQICCYDKESLIDLIERDGNFKLLVGPLAILLVLSHRDRHLPHMVRLVGEFDVCGRSLLRAARAALLRMLLLTQLDIRSSGWLSF